MSSAGTTFRKCYICKDWYEYVEYGGKIFCANCMPEKFEGLKYGKLPEIKRPSKEK